MLELRDRGEDVVYQPPDGRGGVDALVEHLEVRAEPPELLGDRAQVLHRAGHPVELRHDEDVAGA
jgi:hypothetical protein